MTFKNTLYILLSAKKLDNLLKRQAIHRFGNTKEVCNIIDFFIKPESEMVTGQIVYLGGI